MVADGIKGLDTVVGEKFPGTQLQRCVTHLKRNMFAKVRHGDKAALTADLRDPVSYTHLTLPTTCSV